MSPGTEIIELHGRQFQKFIDHSELLEIIDSLAHDVNSDYEYKKPIFLLLLNGAFMFGSALFGRFKGDAELMFVRAKSYEGTQSKATVAVTGLDSKALDGRDILIVEDIVDTGNTLSQFLPLVQEGNPRSVKLATMLFKPTSLQHEIEIDYCGKQIPDDFVVGFGLDYDGLGRNLPHIYSLAAPEANS